MEKFGRKLTFRFHFVYGLVCLNEDGYLFRTEEQAGLILEQNATSTVFGGPQHMQGIVSWLCMVWHLHDKRPETKYDVDSLNF